MKNSKNEIADYSTCAVENIITASYERTVLNIACPVCRSDLIVRSGKYGKFIGCTSFPKCNFTKNGVSSVDRELEVMGSRWWNSLESKGY